jgi:adenosylcobinamide-GDP ribazoletransferase
MRDPHPEKRGADMKLLRSVALAFSMFSRIPVPQADWNEENRRYVLCALPLVGAVIGLGLWGWVWLCEALGLGVFLRAAGLTLLPLAVTGGIHLDGFCDTADALASNETPERKREILKDPHPGVFAVIGLVSYLLLYFGLCTELRTDAYTLLLLGMTHVLSRILCGLLVLCFPASSGKGLLSAFRESADQKRAAACLSGFFALCAAGLLFTGWAGGLMLLAAVACMLHLFVMSRRQFGGMSGDLAGYFLQLCELSMLAALVITQKVMML